MSESTPPRLKSLDAVLVLIFIVMITGPLVGHFFGWDVAQLKENRRPADRPDLPRSWEALSEFPHQYEAYYDDHFGFRNAAIRIRGSIIYSLFKTSPNPNSIIIGKNDMFFSGSDWARRYMWNTMPFTEELFRRWKIILEERRDFAREHGAHFALVLVPMKGNVYTENIPPSLAPIHAKSRREQLGDYLQIHSDVHVIDLMEAMLRAKSHEMIYFNYDHHWNQFGAFAAYQTIMLELNRVFKNLDILDESQLRLKMIPTLPGNMTMVARAGLSKSFEDYAPDLKLRRGHSFKLIRNDLPPKHRLNMTKYFATESPADNPQSVVVFRDSFFDGISPYWAASFSRSLYVWSDMDTYPYEEVILEEKPDIVIWEMPEWRLLNTYLSDNLVESNAGFEFEIDIGRNGEWEISPADSRRNVIRVPAQGAATGQYAVQLHGPGGELYRSVEINGPVTEFWGLHAYISARAHEKNDLILQLEYEFRGRRRLLGKVVHPGNGQWYPLELRVRFPIDRRPESVTFRIIRKKKSLDAPNAPTLVDDAFLAIIERAPRSRPNRQ